LAYGATLLAVLVADAFILFLQLGDGDILVVSETGEVSQALIRDPRLMANETTSLCMTDAWREVRMRFLARYGKPPALIVVSTDGYANSFVNEAAFLKVGSDLLEILQTDGVASVQSNLLSWLEEASTAGSGDDITLAIVYRGDIVTQQATAAPVEAESDVAAAAEPAPPAAPGETVPAPPREARTQGRVARIKQDGPHEPAKQGPLTDLFPDAPERGSRGDGAGEGKPENQANQGQDDGDAEQEN
jgi:hypothetical protein